MLEVEGELFDWPDGGIGMGKANGLFPVAFLLFPRVPSPKQPIGQAFLAGGEGYLIKLTL